MWRSAERMKTILVPLALLFMVGFLMLLVSVATTKKMNRSLLDQIELAESETQVSKKTGETCNQDLKMKNEEINRKLYELENIKEKSTKESIEHEKKKSNMDKSNQLLLQLLMQ